ncbi:MAG: hypothetical protein ACOY0T_37430 [Myxococcota bacterium]
MSRIKSEGWGLHALLTPDEANQVDLKLDAVEVAQRELFDVFALNWPTFGSTEQDAFIADPGGATMVSAIDPTDHSPWLVYANSTGVYRSRDGVRWLAADAQPTGYVGDVQDMAGSTYASLILKHSGTITKCWRSSNAGSTWAGPFPLPATSTNSAWSRIGIYERAHLFIAVSGGGTIAVSENSADWTELSDPGSPYDAYCVVSAAPSESAEGVLVLRNNTTVTWSLDGLVWSQTVLPFQASGACAACWSEYHTQWYLITSGGLLLASPAVDGDWTVVAQFFGQGNLAAFLRPGPSGGLSSSSMIASGPNLIILGQRVASDAAHRSGSILVFNPGTFAGCAIDPFAGTGPFLGTNGGDPGWQRVVRHDGRIVAARVRETTTGIFRMETAASLRSPFLRE